MMLQVPEEASIECPTICGLWFPVVDLLIKMLDAFERPPQKKRLFRQYESAAKYCASVGLNTNHDYLFNMASTSASEAARIQQEIALLTGKSPVLSPSSSPYNPHPSGAINRHKSGSTTQQSTGYSVARPRNSTYVNPNYKPPSTQHKLPTKYVRSTTTAYKPQPPPVPGPSQTRDIVIGGVAFESSGRSLVRKDCALSQFSVQSRDFSSALDNPTLLSVPKPVTAKAVPPRPTNSHADFSRTNTGHLIPSSRTYKPTSRGRGRGRARGRGRPVNMTLDNSRRPYQSVWSLDGYPFSLITLHRAGRSSKRIKYSDKPCPRFTTTGAISLNKICRLHS